MKPSELIKHKYFIFFNGILELQPETFKCFRFQQGFNYYWMVFNYIVLMFVSLRQGLKTEENNLINMACICSIDLLNECLGFFPNWRMRNILLIDDLITIAFDTNEIWIMEVYDFSFSETREHKNSSDDFMEEYLRVMETYGLDVTSQSLKTSNIKQ